MAHALTQQEIHQRLIRLRNYERFYPELRKKYQHLQHENRTLKERIVLLETRDREKDAIIESLRLQMEELRQIVFGKKKRTANDTDDDCQNPDAAVSSHRPVPRAPDSYHRRIPRAEDITKEKRHPIDTCPDCRTPLTRLNTRTFYKEDIILPAPERPLKEVTAHTVEQGYCSKCQKWKTAIPIPSAPVVLGPRVKQYIASLSILIRCSFQQIRTLLQTTYQFEVSDGEISNILVHEATNLRPAFEQLRERIRQQRGAHYDETGWPVQDGEQGNFAWVMTGIETPEAVFAVGQNRGKGNAKALRGSNDTQIGITDDYGAYRALFARHQLCWAHPLRKLRDLARSDMLETERRTHCASMYERFKSLYADLRSELAHPFVRAKRTQVRSRLLERFDALTIPHDDDPQKLRTIKANLQKGRYAYFTCVLHDGIPPDNNKAERALRHLVLKRKTSFGSKTQRGADTMSILASVLLSLWWSRPKNFFQEYTALRGV